MGIAIETIAGGIVGAQAALTAVTMANGDSNRVRSFPTTARAVLEQIMYQATTRGSLQVSSPMFHDPVRGIRLTPGQSPAQFLLPRETGQPLVTGDTLTIELSGCLAAETDVVALSIYYQDLPGTAARLHSWGDIAAIVKSIKPVEVDVAAPAAANAWSDTLINATEDLLHAHTDYAVLGYILDVAGCAVGIRGQDTGNLRICGPAVVTEIDTSDYFVRMSDLFQTPHIPVINADNKGSTFVSVIQGTALAAQKVQLILAELSQPVG